MAEVFDCDQAGELVTGLRQARLAIARKNVVLIPTDTRYALAVNAFSPAAVQTLREVKGWNAQTPPQVLVPGLPTLAALASEVHPLVQTLIDEFWPGPLTVIVPAGESLQWDLGRNRGTVALRMPADEVALALLADTGPLAVSQATPPGQQLSHDPNQILEVFGEQIAVALCQGPRESREPSTIVDATALALPDGRLRLAREGALPREALREVLGEDVFLPETR